MTWLSALLRRPPIGWWDIADILVVSLIIYEVLKLIRGTRAVQMVVGSRCSCSCCSTRRVGAISRRSTF